MFHETYSEYRADCDNCHREILEVIEYMDHEHWDEETCVCPKCKAVFCGKCVKYTTKAGIRCPYCFRELLEFDYVYDLIEVIEHNYQPFETKPQLPKPIKQVIVELESLLEEEECDACSAERIRRQIRDLKIRDMFEKGQKQITKFLVCGEVMEK